MARYHATILALILVPVPGLWAQAPPPVHCRDIHMAPAQTAQVDCTLDGVRKETYEFRWHSADAGMLRLLSDPSVLAPRLTVPAEMTSSAQLLYTLQVLIPGGKPVHEALLRVQVQSPRAGLGLRRPGDLAPPIVECPATLVLHELEMRTIACHATDPATGLSTSLHYRWHVPAGNLSLSSLRVSNPSVVAPPVPKGMGTQTYPLMLAVASSRTQLITQAALTIEVEARDPYMTCPSDIVVQAGASAELGCEGFDPLRGRPAYEWVGLWGTSVAPLHATNVAAPVFTAPLMASDSSFHYMVRMWSSDRSASHRVTVHVEGRPKGDADAVFCDAAVLFELEEQPLRCYNIPAGYVLRWNAPDQTGAPRITGGMLRAPAVEADTVFTYALAFCSDAAGRCLPGTPWSVTVRNQMPPALTCSGRHDTYAGEPDLILQCAVSGGTDYTFLWAGSDIDRLSSVAVLMPTFDVPGQVADDQQFTYTLTVTDVVIGTSSADVQVNVRRRGQISLDCDGRLDYFVYAGSADFPLKTNCNASGAPLSDAEYFHRWVATSEPADTDRLSATSVREPIFQVPDTLRSPYTYTYSYTAEARYSNPASMGVSVTVAPYDDAYDMVVTSSALRFGDQPQGQQVTIDPSTGSISGKVRGIHERGRMIVSSEAELSAAVELVSTVLHHQQTGAVLPLSAQWSLSTSCYSPTAQALSSAYAEVLLNTEQGLCAVLNFGGTLDLSGAAPGPYAGNLDIVLRSGEVRETFLMPVYVQVVAPRQAVTASPESTRLGLLEPPDVTSRQTVSIHPRRALLTPAMPHGTFTLSNPSLLVLEVAVQPVFAYTEARADLAGNDLAQEPSASVGDLGPALVVYPKVFTLGPGQTRFVQYAVREDAQLSERAYATLMEFSTRPRRFISPNRLPLPEDSLRVAHVTLRLPAVYLPGARAATVAATPLSPAGTLLLETAGGPFEGEVVATNADGTEVGRRTVLVLTRSVLPWPLAVEAGEDVTLTFVVREGQAPPPVTVQWR